MIRVGINGFGRIGRCLTRIIKARDNLELVKINASGSLEQNLHLLKYDSIHGRFEGELTGVEWSHTRDIDDIEWPDVDVVLECTGVFNDEQSYIHLGNGAKSVLISSPAKNVDRTVVYGVNHKDLSVKDRVISNASCTTNCLAPIAKVLNNHLSIIGGSMTTIHSYTGDQRAIDKRHKDMYRSRAASISMIPTTTGAAKSLSLVIPELEGKLIGSAIRVPTPNVSCVDLSIYCDRVVDKELVNHVVLDASEHDMKGIIGYETAPLVSVDFNTTTESCILAADSTIVCGQLVRVLCWFDNEWAFSCRMADMASYIGGLNEIHN